MGKRHDGPRFDAWSKSAQFWFANYANQNWAFLLVLVIHRTNVSCSLHTGLWVIFCIVVHNNIHTYWMFAAWHVAAYLSLACVFCRLLSVNFLMRYRFWIAKEHTDCILYMMFCKSKHMRTHWNFVFCVLFIMYLLWYSTVLLLCALSPVYRLMYVDMVDRDTDFPKAQLCCSQMTLYNTQ